MQWKDIYVGLGCTQNCFMLSSLPCFYAFCWSVIPTSRYIINVFILVHVTSFSSRCMLELKFAIYHRAASPSSQASSVDVCSIDWRIIDQTRLSSNTPRKPTVFIIQQSCVIIILLLSHLCACVHVKKKWCRKGIHNSLVSGSNRLTSNMEKARGWHQ